MLAAQAGSFVSMILIKPLVRQPSETNAERGVNLPRQQWDVRAQMSDRAGISAEPHLIPAQTASARDSDHYVTAPETLRGWFIYFILIFFPFLINGSGEMGAKVDPAVSFGCCGARVDVPLCGEKLPPRTRLQTENWTFVREITEFTAPTDELCEPSSTLNFSGISHPPEGDFPKNCF